MRIGILTFPNSTSYGASLQMFALYKAVENKGNEVEVINYYNAFMKEDKHTNTMRNKTYFMQKILLAKKKILHYKLEKEFRKFEKDLVFYPPEPVYVPKELSEIGEKYSKVITGSDQVWNPKITDTDLSYFLDFCKENTKRISYAPSFGIKEFSAEFKAKIKKELEKFTALSVREKEGQVLVEELTERNVQVVLDPTFLLNKEQWTNVEKEFPVEKDSYILYFTVYSSEKLMKFCEKLAKEKNKKIIIVGGNFIKQITNKEKNKVYAHDIGPRQWLYLMHNANCIVTNSFHGTAFSINYNKDFYVEFVTDTNSRLEQIITSADLESRVVGDNCASWNETIDYEVVNKKIDKLRKESNEYLEKALLD